MPCLCAVQLLRDLLSKGISHANCVLNQMEDCASGPLRSERFMCPHISHMTDLLSLPQIENVVGWRVNLNRSLRVFADVPP